MNQKRLWLAALIIAFVIIISFVLTVPHTRDLPKALEPEKAVAVVSSVTLHDVYKKRMHTITGSLVAPDACTSVTAQASMVGNASGTQSISVAITMPASTGVCLELPTKTSFSTRIAAPAGLPLSATVNGAVATATVL